MPIGFLNFKTVKRPGIKILIKMKERRAKAEKSLRIGGRFDCNFLIELGRGKDLHFPSPDGLSETEQVKKKSRIPS